MPANKYRWVILILSYLCMLVFALTLQSLPPILTLVIKDLRLPYAEAGSLMSLFALPAMLLSIPAGLLADRFGPFRIGMLSLILAVIGMSVIVVSGTFLYISSGRVIAGIGAVIISIVSAQTLSQWFRGREAGTAMGIWNTAMPVGTIICFTSFGKLGESFGWRMPISIVVIMGIVVLASFLLLYRNAPNLPQKVQAGEGWARLLSKVPKVGAHIWLTGLCWMWFNAAIISFSTFAPDFFISKGYNIGFAGFLVSLLMWGSLGFSPVIGRLVDKVYNNDIFIGGGGLILSIAIYLVVTSTDYLFPMAVMSVAVALVPAPVFSFVSRVSEPENVGLGFGILSSLSGVGMSFGPYLAGAIRDKTSSYEMSFYFLSILALLVATTAFTLRIMTRRIAQDRDQRAHSLREDLSLES